MLWLRQSTASQEVPLGYFVDSTDGNTEKTALTIAASDIHIWMTGATALVAKHSGGATHMANGIYYAVLDATDSAVLGPLALFVHVTGARPVVVYCCVLPANVYDSLILGSDLLDASVVQWAGTVVATPDVAGEPRVTVSALEDASVTVAAVQAGVFDALAIRVRDLVLDELLSAHTVDGSVAVAISQASLATPVDVPTAADNALAVWSALRISNTIPGSFGEDAGSALSAESIAMAVVTYLKANASFPSAGESQGGSSMTIQLADDANVALSWIGMGVVVCSPTGAAQALKIIDIDLITKVATMNGTWVYIPIAGTPYFVLSTG